MTYCCPIVLLSRQLIYITVQPEWYTKSCSTSIPSIPSKIVTEYVKNPKKGGTDWTGLKIAYDEHYAKQKITKDEKQAASEAL